MFILNDDPLHVPFVNEGLHLIHEIPSEYLHFFDKVVESHWRSLPASASLSQRKGHPAFSVPAPESPLTTTFLSGILTLEVPMLHSLAKNWWASALRGLAALLFGLLTYLLPGITLATLVLLFGAHAVVDGIFNVITFFKVASHQWALLIEGVVGIIAGVLTFALPDITALVLL